MLGTVDVIRYNRLIANGFNELSIFYFETHCSKIF